MKKLIIFTIMVFIFLSKRDMNLVFGNEEDFTHIMKDYLMKNLGIEELDILNEKGLPAVPSYMNYLYNILDSSEGLLEYSSKQLSSDQKIVAINPVIGVIRSTIYRMLISAVDDSLKKYLGGELVFQVKRGRLLSGASVPKKMKICDLDRNFCKFTSAKLKFYKLFYTQWIIIDVDPLLQLWRPELSQGTYTIDIDFRNNIFSSNKTLVLHGPNRPNLVLYTNSVLYHREFERKSVSNYPRIKRSIPSEHSEYGCNLREWKIDVKTLGWEKFIVQPKSIISRYCSGRCDEPLPDNVETTDHAFIRSLWRSLFPVKSSHLPPPTCLAKSLSSQIFLVKLGCCFRVMRSAEVVVDQCSCL